MPEGRLGRPAARELWTWCLTFVGVAFWCEVLRNSDAADPLAPAAMANSILDVGAFAILAWAMLAARARSLVCDELTSGRLIVGTVFVGLLCTIPFRQATTIALFGLAATLLWRRKATLLGRQAGWLLLALALAWTSSCYLGSIHALVARLDAHAAVFLLNHLGLDVTAQGNLMRRGDFVVEVLSACTSSWQLPNVCLAFVVVVLFLRGSFRKTDLLWLALSLLTSVALNEIRLALMARGSAQYEYWHHGTGETIYGVAALAAATLFPLLASLDPADFRRMGRQARQQA
ncbi:MAG TPA: archaeosortase/exosortase family protein [Acetobacteraceae bacterium]|nr:archaeosortase/exosortase family protein [Acetobacteraceae bacterium]